jgi:hypothetical protein
VERTLSAARLPALASLGPLRLIHFRWLLLGLFAWGATEAVSPLAAYDPDVAWLFLAAGGATAVLLATLGRAPAESLWVWILLLVFVIGYFIQTLMVAEYAHDPTFVVTRLNGEWGWIDHRVLVDGMRAFTPPFIAFVLAAVVWLLVIRGRDVTPLPPDAIRSRLLVLVVVAAAASVGLAAVRWTLGIGVMGLTVTELPFRLHTVIFRSQSQLLPPIFLLAIWASDRPGFRQVWITAMAAALGHAVLLSLLATSKAGVVWFALPILFMWICSKTFTRARLSLLPLTAAGLVILYPLIGAWRIARIGAESGLSPEQASVALQNLASTSTLDVVKEVVPQIVVRVTGAAGVWFTLRQSTSPNDWMALWREGKEPLALVFTREVYDVTAANDFRAPGLVAAFFLIAGQTGSLAVWAGFTWLIGVTWLWIGRLRTGPVARAVVGYQLALFAMEGTLQFQDLAIAVLVALFLDLLYRWWLTQPPAVPAGDLPAPADA